MKVFISQPMRGLTDEEIIKAREEAFAKLQKNFIREYGIKNADNLELIDNTQFEAPAEMHATWYLSNDIRMMGEADIVYFLKGWEKAHGCMIEFTVAREYGMQIMFEDAMCAF